MKTTSDIRPSALETSLNNFCQEQNTINFDIKYIRASKKYEFERIELAPGHFNYANMVSAIIEDRYSKDNMDAVVNNYLCEPEDETYAEEFKKMQEWRAHAKEVAKSYFVQK